GAGGGRAGAAEAGAEVLEQGLGEEVVRWREHQAEQFGHGGRGGRCEQQGARRGGGGAARAVHAHAVRCERLAQLARGIGGGRVGTAFAAAGAAVEGERTEGAFEERVEGVSARGLARQ